MEFSVLYNALYNWHNVYLHIECFATTLLSLSSHRQA